MIQYLAIRADLIRLADSLRTASLPCRRRAALALAELHDAALIERPAATPAQRTSFTASLTEILQVEGGAK